MKKILIPFIVFLYLSQITVVIGLATAFALDLYIQDIWVFLLIAVLFGFTAFCLAVTIFAFGIIQIARGKPNGYLQIMVTKLVLVPFFVVNFIMVVILIGAMGNPFLMWAIPAVLIISVSLTFFSMFATSFYNIGTMIYQLRKKEVIIERVLAHIIFHFIFVFDVISAVIIYIQSRKSKSIVTNEIQE